MKRNTTRSRFRNTQQRIDRMGKNKMGHPKNQPSKSGTPNQADYELARLMKERMELAEKLKDLNSQFKSRAPECFRSM